MASHQVTIKDIAKILGISASTVSRALKDHPDISPKTKKMVQAFAAKVHYRPNALALNLRRSKTNTIGIIIPEIVHHFFSSVLAGIDKVAYAAGYNVMICQSNEDYDREVSDAQALLDNRVDGILMSLSKTTTNFDHINGLIDNGVPVVFFDRAPEGISADRVVIDDYVGAKIATHHLISIGCKKILHLAGPQHLAIGKRRKEGYESALNEIGIDFNPDYLIKCDTRDEVFANAGKILTMANEIDGIFAVNDSTAIAAMQVLMKNGIKIPDHIAVIGFGDGPNATIAYPPLSTVEQKGIEMGKEAIQLLINQIENEEETYTPQTKVLTPVLRIRESTAKFKD
ncbi:LacI family DNA-binding transcriptional regulator [Labilibacter marinus]|uniref:LacI family DNA-binding transcriptional regulator n=1 Tax=Labilibacter marinus TaxID=1477105 RepID=UPI00082EBDF7|nr:LacI family DNA-binding transcriptional regulator [Labilibacter marinus]